MKGDINMEAQLSLGDVTKSVFTSDYSSKYKTVTAGSAFCDMLTTNTIKQSISVDSSNTSEIKESEYKIKEAEKIISKNILFSIYEFNINAKYSTYSYYLGQNIHTYEYTNLTNDEVPSFKKLHMYLDQISTVLNNHKGIVSSKDTGNQLYHSLQEFIDEINDSSTKIYSLVMGGKIANVEADTFIISAERLFKGESSFKTKSFIGDKAKIAAYFNSVKSKYLDIANSVAGYNDGLQQAIVKFNKVMDALATEYKSNYSQVALQVEYKKEELRNVLYAFAMKYFNLTNILYSIKADCVHEYLNPSYSDYDNLLTIKENYSLNNDMDFLDESTDLFDDDSMFESTRQVDFSFRTIELEEAFFAYTVKSLLEDGEQTKDKEQVADASKKIKGTTDNPASADEKNRIRKGGKIKNSNWFKELWNKIMNFIKSCIEKVTFAVKKKKDKLFEILNSPDSVKKITDNLEKSDDAYTFRVYNASSNETATRINTMAIPQIHEVLPTINNEQDLEKLNADVKDYDKKMALKFPNYIKVHGICERVVTANNEADADKEKRMIYKNYFAGYDENAIKAGFEDIKNNTENKAKNNILASLLSVKQMKDIGINTIIANIRLIKIEQLKAQYDNFATAGNAWAQKVCAIMDKANAKSASTTEGTPKDTNNGNTPKETNSKEASTNTPTTTSDTKTDKTGTTESARITIESVMSEYFGELVQIHEAENDKAQQIDSAEISKTIKEFTDVANAIFTCANFACEQMLDNYYNIFNALLSGELKVGANNTSEKKEEEKKEPEAAKDNSVQSTPSGNQQNPAPAKNPAINTPNNTYNSHTGRAQPKQTIIKATTPVK